MEKPLSSMPALLGEFAFHVQFGANAKRWHAQKLHFGTKKALKNSPLEPIDPSTQILLMEDEERRGIPKGTMWKGHFLSQFLPLSPGSIFGSPVPSRLFPAATIHLVLLSQS